MEIENKFKILASHENLEIADDFECHVAEPAFKNRISIAKLPGGKSIKLAKTLLTSACERNCYYCPFRAGRNYRRETLRPSELAKHSFSLYQKGLIHGIFISSGIVGGGRRTQDLLIQTAEILRHKYGYKAYLHLKIMPGADNEQVLLTMQLADRVSINLEGPNEETLRKLAPQKALYDELLTPLRWVNAIRSNQPGSIGWNGRWPSATTQFVVGGAGETDHALLQTSDFLYKRLKLGRVYYSAFTPIEDTPLDNLPPESPARKLRLYQASFMLRDYGFIFEDLPFDNEGNLPLYEDPKLIWAKHNLMANPVEINKADKSELLRVPGIGHKTAQYLMKVRNINKIRSLEDLRKIGLWSDRFIPFILLDGKRISQQLILF